MNDVKTHCDLLDNITRKDLQQIRTGLRQAFIRSNYKGEFLRTKRVEVIRYKTNGDTAKRPYIKYECIKCLKLYSITEINVDHIDKVGAFNDVLSIKDFFFNIWCEYSNLQILCKDCHKLKTKYERSKF